MACALRFQSTLPKHFWEECVLAASYLINCTPYKILKGKTPFELLYGNAPSYSRIKVLGCLAFVGDHKLPKDKFYEYI